MRKFSQLGYHVCFRCQTFQHFTGGRGTGRSLIVAAAPKAFSREKQHFPIAKIYICSCISKRVLFVHLIRSACILQIRNEKIYLSEER